MGIAARRGVNDGIGDAAVVGVYVDVTARWRASTMAAAMQQQYSSHHPRFRRAISAMVAEAAYAD